VYENALEIVKYLLARFPLHDGEDGRIVSLVIVVEAEDPGAALTEKVSAEFPGYEVIVSFAVVRRPQEMTQPSIRITSKAGTALSPRQYRNRVYMEPAGS